MKTLNEIPGIENLIDKLNDEMETPCHGESIRESLFPSCHTEVK